MNLLKVIMNLEIISPKKKLRISSVQIALSWSKLRNQFLAERTTTAKRGWVHQRRSCIMMGTLILLSMLFPTPKAFADGIVYLPLIPNTSNVATNGLSGQNDSPVKNFSQHQVTNSLELLSDAQNVETGSNVYYVSKSGSNGNGQSWSSAWNELDQIDWSVIQAGATILIDGGQNEMVYYTTLQVIKSGTEKNPIVIQLADEAGRNGKAIFNGGRGATLPYCGQSSYTDNAQNARQSGIIIDNQSWVIIDGTKWSGFTIYRYTRSGLFLDRGSSHITVRNMEIYDNGEAKRQSNGWMSARPGIRLGGNNHVLDRLIVHDNGEDAVQSLWGQNELGNITITRSWLYNKRQHPTVKGESFNYCTHTDGFQIYDGGLISGITIEESVIGPGFTNGVILGQTLVGGNTWADVQNVTFRNVIFSKAAENGIYGYTKTNSQNWVLDQVTLDCSNTKYNCIKIDNSRHSVQNSIIYGSKIDFRDGLDRYENNCQWGTNGFAIGQTADPLFRTLSANDPFALADYTLPANSPCRGKGASITSAQNLLDSAENQSRPRIINTPNLTCNTTKGVLIEAEDGEYGGQFNRVDGYLEHTVDVDKPWLGGSVAYDFEARENGIYHIRTLVSAANASENSYFVHIDEQPTDDYMIWDIQPTSGFEERMVSWRGSGTVEDNEYMPMIFHLSKGTHTLIIRGREAKTKLDQICIEQR